MRRSLVSDLPAAKMAYVHDLFIAEAVQIDAPGSPNETGQRAIVADPGSPAPAAGGASSPKAPHLLSTVSLTAGCSAQEQAGPLMPHHAPALHHHDAAHQLVVSKVKAATLLRKLGLILDELRRAPLSLTPHGAPPT
jgi:hypothetical protein